jgi:hypothetical protein
VYFGKEVRARVVDADTGQPIEGAAVISRTELFRPGPGHGGTDGLLVRRDAVTAADGSFVLRSWGPRFRGPFTYLEGGDPNITIFKAGYDSPSIYNPIPRTSMIRESVYYGATIRLKPSTMKPRDRILFLESLFRDYAEGDPSEALYREMIKEEGGFQNDRTNAALARSVFTKLHRWARDRGLK